MKHLPSFTSRKFNSNTFRIFQIFALSALLFFLSTKFVFAQWPPIPTGVPWCYQASNPLSCSSGQPSLIDWGDGCITTVPNVSTVYHLYQRCGEYSVVAHCGSSQSTPPVVVHVQMPALIIEQVQTPTSDIECGRIVELGFRIGIDETCGSTFGAAVKINGQIPPAFEVVDAGLFDLNGQNVSLEIPPNALPAPQALNTYFIRIKPRICTPTTSSYVNFSIDVPTDMGRENIPETIVH